MQGNLARAGASAGLALLDYDLDGDLDLYVVNGWRLDGAAVIDRGANALYANRGDGTFVDVTAATGVGDDGWGTAVTVPHFHTQPASTLSRLTAA